MRVLIGVVIVLALSSCTSLPERIARSCDRAGFARGTPEFSQCYQIAYQEQMQSQAVWGSVLNSQINANAASQRGPTVTTGSCTSVGVTSFCNAVTQ